MYNLLLDMAGKKRGDSRGIIRRSVSIFKFHDEWLKAHEEINFSEEVRDLIDELMDLVNLKEMEEKNQG